MKRHPGLQPLSHDHHDGLVHAYRMTKAAEGKKDAATVADAYLAYWPGELSRHFREEEEVIAPLLLEHGGAEDIQRARLLSDHQTIHTLSEDLRAAREENRPLLLPLAALGNFLERHIRFEEREIFPCLEQTVDEETLNTLPNRLSGGPHCNLK